MKIAHLTQFQAMSQGDYLVIYALDDTGLLWRYENTWTMENAGRDDSARGELMKRPVLGDVDQDALLDDVQVG